MDPLMMEWYWRRILNQGNKFQHKGIIILLTTTLQRMEDRHQHPFLPQTTIYKMEVMVERSFHQVVNWDRLLHLEIIYTILILLVITVHLHRRQDPFVVKDTMKVLSISLLHSLRLVRMAKVLHGGARTGKSE